VPIYGDTEVEDNEYFYVNLSNPTNATIADNQGQCTIQNDDGSLPNLSIDDVPTIDEGIEGTTNAVFTVNLSDTSSVDVTVDFTTVDGTANAGSDYVTTSGTLTIPAESTSASITVPIYGDTEVEDNEYFYVNLSNPTNATIADGQGQCTIRNDDTPPPSSGPQLQTGTVTAWTNGWTLVTLDDTYTEMVVVCTPNYDKFAYPSAVHIRNASGNSFEVRLVPAVYGLSAFEPPWSAEVHWMAVEAGVYTVEEHGVKMEATIFYSTVTDGSSSWGSKGSWVGQNQSYANSYANPVVVGQVMTYNNLEDREYYWSVFWSRGSSRTSPPSSTELWVGKHNAQDARVVNDETIGYVVFEAGEGIISSNSGPVRYKASLGSDSIRGMGNGPPYSYSLGGLPFTPTTAILSQAAMDGRDGGWAVLYGINPVTSNWLYLAIEEDWVWDSERKHTTEQVGYIVFE
jgi:hypothetical protein